MEINLDQLKNDVLQKLRSGETNVRFTKVDGSERSMRCTLTESLIPTDKRPKVSENAEGKSETASVAGQAIRAFDLDIGEWRSFRLSSLISY